MEANQQDLFRPEPSSWQIKVKILPCAFADRSLLCHAGMPAGHHPSPVPLTQCI